MKPQPLLLLLLCSLILVGDPLAVVAKPARAPQPAPVETDVQGKPLFHQGMITIKFHEGVGPFSRQEGVVSFGISSLNDIAGRFHVNSLEKRFRHRQIPKGSGLPDLSRIYRITFPESFSVRAVAEAFARDHHVEYAEPIPVSYPCEVPDDPLYDQLQHLPQIWAPQAWDIHHGDDGPEQIVIGIADDAVEWFHPDLVHNIWHNLGEDADGDGHVLEMIGSDWVFDPGDENGFDDDGNGYVDDFIGWNFINEFGGQDNDPAPDHPSNRHGTHCIGIAAGVTNNQIGIASVSWNVKFMATKHSISGTIYYDSDPYEGIIYCAENGAHVSTNSWRGYGYSQADREVIDYATGLGCIVVAAAGNEDWDVVSYPGGYPGCVSVASVAVTDVKAGSSCYGAAIDVAAPGGDAEVDGGILSTVPGGYDLMRGTSMATPMVAGALGLIKSYHPDWSNDQVITQLIGTADDIDAQNPGYENLLGSGRINAFRALSETGVIPPQELKLDIVEVEIDDQNGNGVIEQGETVVLNLTLRNYATAVSTDDASFTLTATDPDITILVGSCNGSIPADDYFDLETGFEIGIATDATTHITTLTLHVDANVGIAVGEEMEFDLLIEPAGVLVWDGAEGGVDYSGLYISDFMERLGLDIVYTTDFPASLAPFDAVFLSFGNYDTDNTSFWSTWASEVQTYLENGGGVFLEGGEALGWDQASNTELLSLFGLASAQDGTGETPIHNLAGQAGTLTEGMLFTSSIQQGNAFIDTYTPNDSGLVAFIESDVGNVAVQGSGTYGQKTFCFSYALAGLVDRDSLSNRGKLLLRIVDFFDLPLSQGYVVANFLADATLGYAPAQISFIDLSLCDENNPIGSWKWDFDGDGTIDSEGRHPVWTYTEPGIYAVTLIADTGLRADTLTIPDLVTIGSYVSGTWQAAISPYYISHELAVADGATLVIEPGVEVIFTGHYGLRVEGCLKAIGTEQTSIRFTAQDPDAGWGGIEIVPGSLDDDSTKIVYATVEYGWAKGGAQSLSSLGGGITVHGVDEVVISHCLIQSNRASGSCSEWPEGAGGGISIRYASPTISYNAILNNTTVDGGGIGLEEASPLIVGNLIAGNTATWVGGGIAANLNCHPVIVNNTICGNNGGWYGGALIFSSDCNPVIRNTILWGNTAEYGDQVCLAYAPCNPVFSHCDVEGGLEAFVGGAAGSAFTGTYEYCIDADPLFANPDNCDFHLTWANFPTVDSTRSPCIDAGDPDSTYNDPDGTRNDIGAFYFDYDPDLGGGVFPGMTVFQLQQNYPNPFNPGARGTRIEYSLPAVIEHGWLDIHNLAGHRIRRYPVAHSESTPRGVVVWDGTDREGNTVGPGVYVCRLKGGSRSATKKIVVTR